MKKATSSSTHLSKDNSNVCNYLSKKLNLYRNSEEMDTILDKPKKEIVHLLQEKLKREPLKWENATKELSSHIAGNAFLSDWTDTAMRYANKIKDRELTEKEYNKIMKEIAEEGSILPMSHKRNFSYWWGDWDVILSATTGKMYCVESDKDREEFLSDYEGKQYYWSRSGASGAWFVVAGKKSLIYLPTKRKDVADPWVYNGYGTGTINGLEVFARANRGIVDKAYPITILTPTDSEYDFIFIDPNHIENIITIIKSWGELPENFKQFQHSFWYYIDESGNSQKLSLTYCSDKKQDNKTLKDIIERTGRLSNEQHQLQPTGSEFDRVIWIYKSWNNFVEKWSLGVARKLYGTENPRESLHNSELFEYVIGDWWRIEKEYFGESESVIRGRHFFDKNIAYREDKDNPEKYKVMVEYNYKDLWIDEWSEELFNAFVDNHVGSTDYSNYKEVNLWDKKIAKATSSGDSVIFYADNIEKDEIKKTSHHLLTKTKEVVQELYESNLNLAFNHSLELAKKGENYLDWRNVQWDMLYSSFGDKVYLWYITKDINLNEKFQVFGKDSLQDYEKVISQWEWETKWAEYWEEFMRLKAYDKSINKYMNNIRRDTKEEIRALENYLNEHKEEQFFISDSESVGNCIPGTEAFMEKYGIKEGITWNELLQHKRFKEMLETGRFRAVILKKVVKTIVD